MPTSQSRTSVYAAGLTGAVGPRFPFGLHGSMYGVHGHGVMATTRCLPCSCFLVQVALWSPDMKRSSAEVQPRPGAAIRLYILLWIFGAQECLSTPLTIAIANSTYHHQS